MLNNYQKLVLPDKSGKSNDIFAEINWNEASKGQYVRFTLGDKQCIVKKDHLYSILFILGNEKEQDKIISPFVKQTRVTKFTKMIGITTGKNIGKGELINVLLEFTFNPETNQMTIGKGNRYSLRKNLI